MNKKYEQQQPTHHTTQPSTTPTTTNSSTPQSGVDKKLVQQRFRRSVNTYNHSAIVQRIIANQLFTYIGQYAAAPYSKVLEIGCGTGFLTEKLIANTRNLFANDLVAEYCPLVKQIADNFDTTTFCYLPGDAETIPIPDNLSLIASASTFQWFVRGAATYERFARALQSSGVLAFSSFAPNNFPELRQIFGSGLATHSINDLKSIVGQHFEVVQATAGEHVLYFNTPTEVLRHMKLSGVNGLRTKPWTKADLGNFEQKYQHFFVADKGYSLTYRPIYIIAIKH